MRLVAEELEAERGGEIVFSGISLSVAAGEALIVTGPNGAGKTTLLRMLAGFLAPSAGRIDLEGASDEGGGIAGHAHYLGHRNAMKREMSVRENLVFWQRFLGAPALAPAEAAEKVGLGGVDHLPYGYLSAGQQRRIAMARLLVSHRPIWLLDEPTAALDKASETMFAGLVDAHQAAGGIVIAATHQPLGLTDPQRLEMRPAREVAP